jgi:hypothetical protein
MPKLITNICKVCETQFSVAYKLRHKQTCSKACSYKLRQISRKKVWDAVPKTCDTCGQEFEDTSKKGRVTTCNPCVYKKMSATRNENGSYVRTREQNEKLSASLKKKYAEGWQPLSEECKLRSSVRMKKMWASGKMAEATRATCLEEYDVEHWTKSQDAREFISSMKRGSVMSDESRKKMSISASRRVRENPGSLHSRGKGGFREDLGFYVRSEWEAAYARYLVSEGIGFEYEPDTFELSNGMTYTPDFRICDGKYVEVKGWWDDKSILKCSLFEKEYPEIDLVKIDESSYNLIQPYMKD